MPGRFGRASRLLLGAAVVAVAAAGFLLLRRAAVPDQAAGEAWLAAFADRLAAPETWNARGPAALALFPKLGPWSADGCVLEWSRRDPGAPVVTYQRLELGREAGQPCREAQFGMVSTRLRQSDGVTPGALAERFTERFGPPDVQRDASPINTVTTTWQIQDGIFAHMEERLRADDADTFSVLFVRSVGAPTRLADAAEGERWMDRTVALFTGPDLADARGSAAVALIDANMRPSPLGDDPCPTTYFADGRTKGPIGSGQMLSMDRPDGAPCERSRFSALSMRVWQREPVTAGALATRLTAALGPPALSRDFERDGVGYRWNTAHGTTVELTENLSGNLRRWLSLRAWQP